MKVLYGFGKPYDFHKILPFLAGLFLLLTILVAAGARFAATGYLNWGALRDAYSLYLVGLSLAGMLVSIFPRIAWFVLAICFTEFLIGIGGYALAAIHVLPMQLFPANAAGTAPVGQFQYHPLLQVIPTPNYSRLHPFAISHDSNGIRRCPEPMCGSNRSFAAIWRQLPPLTRSGILSAFSLGRCGTEHGCKAKNAPVFSH
jgi:hypothetical protein